MVKKQGSCQLKLPHHHPLHHLPHHHWLLGVQAAHHIQQVHVGQAVHDVQVVEDMLTQAWAHSRIISFHHQPHSREATHLKLKSTTK